jgi:IPT/TIG domain
MRFRWACLTVCASQFWGCDNPRPTLTRVEPGQAYSDSEVRLTLVGDGFIPATTLDPGSGRRVAVIDGFRAIIGKGNAWAELTDLAWQSTGQMTASLPIGLAAGLPSGYLDVDLVDPRGQSAVLENGFYELGRDLTPPVVTFISPAADTPVGPGTILHASIHASDAPLGALTALEWTYVENGVERGTTKCLVAELAVEADCAFQVKVSPNLNGGETIQIVADAVDASLAKNLGETILAFTVQAKATLASIWPVSGGTAGGTDIVITGSGFIAGSQALVDDVPIFLDGGVVLDNHTISGHVPAHAEGPATVTVRTPLGDALGKQGFSYLPPPLVKAIAPSIGDTVGGTAVVLTGQNFSADTRIYFGSTLESAVPLLQLFLQNDNSIIGRAPAGSGQTTVWALDQALGFTRLPNAFGWRTP